MQATIALFSVMVIGILASNIVTYAMVEEVNRKRARTGEKPRKWNRDLPGIICDYRGACPEGKLIWVLIAALLCLISPLIAFAVGSFKA
jgi:hypothetical protein